MLMTWLAQLNWSSHVWDRPQTSLYKKSAWYYYSGTDTEYIHVFQRNNGPYFRIVKKSGLLSYSHLGWKFSMLGAC